MWVLDYLPEIESDLSVFHRIDDPMAISSSRYYRLAELLPHYDGAVRHALARDLAQQGGPTEVDFQPQGMQTPAPAGATEVALETQLAMAAGGGEGFPDIEYVS